MKTTRECTEVHFRHPGTVTALQFSEKPYVVLEGYSCKPYKSKKRKMDADAIEQLLVAKEKELKKRQDKKEEELKPEKKPKLSWREEINRKRYLIASFLSRQTDMNLAEACRFTGCTFGMVKRVAEDLRFNGAPSDYDYPNQKPPQEVNSLNRSILEACSSYSTIKDIKRRHPKFSRKWIARQLKRTGYKWLIMAKERKKPKQPRYQSTEVIAVVKHLCQALMDTKVTTYYVDEAHFPMFQTSTHHWRKAGENQSSLVYNHRDWPDETKLSAIALCTLEEYVAVQIFKRDITADDFLFFIQEVLRRLPRGAQVTILADNASWHTADKVAKTKANDFLFFNAPGLFVANAIENAFSFVRADWRKRPPACSLEEEAALLVKIFFDPDNKKRFKGISRNHLRSLRRLLDDSHMLLATQKGDGRAKDKGENEGL